MEAIFWLFHRTSCTSRCPHTYLFPTILVFLQFSFFFKKGLLRGRGIYFRHPFCLWCALSNRKFKKQITAEENSGSGEQQQQEQQTDGLPLIFYWFSEIRFMPSTKISQTFKSAKRSKRIPTYCSPDFAA